MKALVTGGGGYLGSAVVRMLRARGDEVVVVGRRRYAEAEALGAVCVVCDLASDDPALAQAMEGCDVVFHVAALPPHRAPRAAFVATNVDGTRRVLDAVRAARVKRLVYTSTPSVAFTGEPQEGVGIVPIAERFESPYAETKALAEAMVIAARGPELAVVALRPRLIYGPGEPHMIPRLMERHRQGRLRIVGDGTNRVGLTYIDNAAVAHLQAADALSVGARCDGGAYFVTDPEPVVLWAWIGSLLQGVGLPPLKKRISLRAARAVGRVLEAAWSVLPLAGDPPMTPFVALNLATSCWYDLTRSREAFGLRAAVSGEQGLEATIRAFRGG